MLEQTIKQLQQRKNQLVTEIGRLEIEAKKISQAITILSKLSGRVKTVAKKRKMSAAGKAKIRAAQKARWARWKQEQKTK